MNLLKYTFCLLLIIGFAACSQESAKRSLKHSDKATTTESTSTPSDGYAVEERIVKEKKPSYYSGEGATSGEGPAGPEGETTTTSTSESTKTYAIDLDINKNATDITFTDIAVTPPNPLASGPPVETTEEISYDEEYEFKSEESISLDAVSIGAEKSGKKTRVRKDSKRKELEESVMDDTDDVALEEELVKPEAGLLTAGEIHDFSKWELWQDITADQLNRYQNRWSMYPENRYAVQVMNEDGYPVVDAVVKLSESNQTVWEARTDNTGKAELWYGFFDKTTGLDLKITAQKDGQKNNIEATPFYDGMNHITLNVDCATNNILDIAFVVDATGSMGDEIRYLQVELLNIIERTKALNKNQELRLGTVFYRDQGEQYVTRFSPLSKDPNATNKFIREQVASGGGDYPEAVEEALDVAINQLQWKDEATARLLFLVLDAPPHENESALKKMKELTLLAAKKGVRIIPITGSGVDKSTEYLMRALALASNGTYTFLTDDSGVGGKHIKPTTDSYKVEKLNDLIVRLIKQYTTMSDCKEEDNWKFQDNQTVVIRCYPNPTDGFLNVEWPTDITEFFVTDANGKILERYTDQPKGTQQLDLRQYPNGIYYLRAAMDGKTATSRFVIVH